MEEYKVYRLRWSVRVGHPDYFGQYGEKTYQDFFSSKNKAIASAQHLVAKRKAFHAYVNECLISTNGMYVFDKIYNLYKP